MALIIAACRKSNEVLASWAKGRNEEIDRVEKALRRDARRRSK